MGVRLDVFTARDALLYSPHGRHGWILPPLRNPLNQSGVFLPDRAAAPASTPDPGVVPMTLPFKDVATTASTQHSCAAMSTHKHTHDPKHRPAHHPGGNLDAGEPPASDGTNLDLADARGPAWTPKQRRILASGKKMALGNGSTPPPDPRVHPEHRFRRRAGMAAGSPSTGTNRFRPSIT